MAFVAAYIVVEMIVLIMGVGVGMDSALHSESETSLIYLLAGASLGLLLGGLLAWLFYHNLRSAKPVISLPLWVATAISAELVGGFVYMWRANQPGDWRLTLTTVELGSIPGLVVGSFLC